MKHTLLLAALSLLLPSPTWAGPGAVERKQREFAAWGRHAGPRARSTPRALRRMVFVGGRRTQQRQLDEPFPVPLAEASPLDQQLSEAAQEGRWRDMALLLAAPDAAALEQVLLRSDVAVVGGREDLRRRLRRLSGPALLEYRRATAGVAGELLGRRGPGREDALLTVALDYPALAEATDAARELGDLRLERGDLAGAALAWRLGLLRGPNDQLSLRLLRLRARLSAGRSQAVHPGRQLPSHWGVKWARRAAGGSQTAPRALEVDGSRVYLSEPDAIVAVRRDDGRLVWRRPLQGQPTTQQLCRSGGVLLLRQPDELVALGVSDGQVLWRRSAERPEGAPEQFADLAAVPGGFVLVGSEGGSQRLLLGLDTAGRERFRRLLWQGRASATPWRTFYANKPPGNLTPLEFAARPLEEQTKRPSMGLLEHPRRPSQDGRLAVAGARVFFTYDGRVAAADVRDGSLLWLQPLAPALEVAGERVLVEVEAGPFAVEAVTASGALVRLDPLDGRPLKLPQAPRRLEAELHLSLDPQGPRDEHLEPAQIKRRLQDAWNPLRPYVLSTSPLVLLHRRDYSITRGLEHTWITRLPQGPLGPGVRWGQLLALPFRDELCLYDLSGRQTSGEPVAYVAWPEWLTAGPLVSRGGLLLVTGPEGLAVFSSDDEPAPTDPPHDEAPAEWIRLLDADDWRLRLQAQRRLLALVSASPQEATVYLDRASPRTQEGLTQILELRTRIRRRELIELLAKSALKSNERLVGQILDGVALVDNLAKLRREVISASKKPAQTTRALLDELLGSQDPEVRYALFLIAVKIDDGIRGKVAQLLRAEAVGMGLRAAAAETLLDLCQDPVGGSKIKAEVTRLAKSDEGIAAVFVNSFGQPRFQNLGRQLQNSRWLGPNANIGALPAELEDADLVGLLGRIPSLVRFRK